MDGSALSRREWQLLVEIETALREEDPALDRRLRTMTLGWSRRRRPALRGVRAAAVVVLIALALGLPVAVAQVHSLRVLVLLGAIWLVALTGLLRHRRKAGRGPGRPGRPGWRQGLRGRAR